MNKFLIFTILLNFTVFAQKPSVTFPNLLFQKDVVIEGAKGFNISGKCNFAAYKQSYKTDSLMNKAFLEQAFYLTITPSIKDTIKIAPAMGYSVAFPDDKIVQKIKIKPSQINMTTNTVDFSWFVPYAALKLNSGEQIVSVSLNFYGKDGFNNVVSGKQKTEKLTFTKPKTRVFEMQFTSLTVNAYDTNGQLWDIDFSGKDKPDLDLSIQLGNLMVNSVHKGNNLSIDFRNKPRVFKFVISENDEVYFKLVDSDDIADDPIASWKYNTTNMKDDILYKQDEKKANLSEFNFSAKAGILK